MRVVLAPDKFKGTLTAELAAAALAEGWRSRRPQDELVLLPMADGGDGTAAVLAGSLPDPHWVQVASVNAVGAPHLGRYLRSGDTAVVELAQVCGIADLTELAPLSAHTIGLGIVIAAALRDGVTRLVIAPAGSASTDGGSGALSAMGARLVGHRGILPVGGAGLANLARIDTDRLIALPPGGAVVLVDVEAVLCGANGAAAIFAPQKGAGPDEVAELDLALSRFADILGGDRWQPGSGAAGGTAYGLACWGAELQPGASTIGGLIGLPEAVSGADLVITGEGSFDETSLSGKACGYVLGLLGNTPGLVVAGSVATEQRSANTVDLTELAGSSRAAMTDPQRWLVAAGAMLAARISGP
jgi:glycerate kinase